LFDDVPPPLASGWTGRTKTSFVPLEDSDQPGDNAGTGVEDWGADEEHTQVEPTVWEQRAGWENVSSISQQKTVAEAPVDNLAETRPMQLGTHTAESLTDGPEVMPEEISASGDLEPVSAAVCNLNYACMLIPRLPPHHLTGDLGTNLSEWVGQLCLAFGWRLGHLAVRPEYLLWVVNVSPTVSPSYLVRMIRQHTSQRIFARFPDLMQDNPSGDFWAPGYLVMSSSQPPPVDVMQDFIQGTRRRQGATKSPWQSH
jgi:REP element-mobilizing transposase RayT